MKSVRRFSLIVALITLGHLLTGCSQGGTNTAAPGGPVASGTSSPKPVPYPGVVDKSDCEAVGGWVLNRVAPDAETKVELYIDDQLIETIPAATLRPDLTAWSSGKHGFSFKVPANLKDGKSHTMKIKVAGTDHEVPFLQSSPRFQCTA